MISEERLRELWLACGTGMGGAITFARAVEREAYEAAAKVAWIHYMDACRAQILNAAEHEQWLCAATIRALKETT